MTLLQQRQQERELEHEREQERERARERSSQALKELEARVQALVEQGLLQMRHSPSGHLELQVVPVIPQVTQKGHFSVNS